VGGGRKEGGRSAPSSLEFSGKRRGIRERIQREWALETNRCWGREERVKRAGGKEN